MKQTYFNNKPDTIFQAAYDVLSGSLITEDSYTKETLNEDAAGRIPKEQLNKIEEYLGKLYPNNYGNGKYYKRLFDPVQSHAIYGLTDINVDKEKEKLKKLDARNFRIVKSSVFRILCFDASKMKVD